MGKLEKHMQNSETGLLSQTLHRNQLKMDKHFNIRPDTIKCLEEIIHKTFSDKNHKSFFRSVNQGNRNKTKNKQM